jgi:hypothetical protein
MKFIQTGTYNKDFLEEITTLNLKESISNILLDKLDYFIGFIALKKSEILADFCKNLLMKYQELSKKHYSEITFQEIQNLSIEHENINQFPELLEASLRYLFNLLKLKEKEFIEISDMKLTMRALIEAWTFPSYYLIETLTETIERKEAVKFYKQLITQFYIDNPSPDRDKFTSLRKRFENRTTGDTASSGWVIVHTMLGEGKYAFKNKNCPTCVDSMKDLQDVEIKYLACCYPDYEKFRAYSNNHIILTMEHTLMEGDLYCSRVMHDTRFDYDLRHPPKDFWDNFEPGKEEEAMKYYKNQ